MILSVAVGEHPNQDVFSVPPAGRPARQLTDTPASEQSAKISPDGQHVVFGRLTSNTSLDLFLMRVKDRKIVRLTRTAEVNEWPQGWSPDGRYLSVLQEPETISDAYNHSLWIYDVVSVERRRLVRSDWMIQGGRWSPDGSRIVYAAQVVDPLPGGLNWELFSIRPDGTERTRLTRDPQDDYMADWSPDGQRLAFVHGISDGDRPPTQIWVMKPDGSGQRRVHTIRGFDDLVGPVWSPSGRWIAFIRRSYTEGKTSDVWRVEASGKRAQPLTKDMDVRSLDWHNA